MNTEVMTWMNVDENHWVSLRGGRVWRVTRTEDDGWYFSSFDILNPSVIFVGSELFDTPYEAMIVAKSENDLTDFRD